MKGDLNLVWSKFGKDLHKYILSKVKDDDISKDILQDTIIKIHENLPNLRDENSLRFWVFKLVRNSIIDFYRKKNIQYEIQESSVTEDDISPATQSLSKCIMPFINCLPEIYKEALTLTEFQNYSQLELARHLGISYSGAKSRVQRAKVKLREAFEECCNIQSDQYGNIIDYSSKSKCCTDK